MGLLGILTGWDKTMAAINAVMANHVLENANGQTRQLIAQQVLEIITSVQTWADKSSLLKELNNDNRVVQLNFVALACDNLGIQEPFKKSAWTRVKNPYSSSAGVDDMAIRSAIDAIRYDDKSTAISWPGIESSIDFGAMIESGELINTADNLASPIIHEFNDTQALEIEMYKKYIFDDDKEAFGADLFECIENIVGSTYIAINANEKVSLDHPSKTEVSDYGADLISLIAIIAIYEVLRAKNGDSYLVESMLTTINNSQDSFGPDLINLCRRICLYRLASMGYQVTCDLVLPHHPT